jgi:sugar phosphate isomerase/epimerase
MITSFPLRRKMDMKKVMNIAKKAGYRGVEISIYPSQRSRDAFLKVKKQIKDFDLVTAHYPLHSEEARMLYSTSMLKRRIAIKLLTDEFAFLSKFEPELYIVHAARAYSPLEDFVLLKEECEKYGMKLSVENGTSYPRSNLDHVRRICNLLEVGMTLDIGHAFVAKENIEDFTAIKDIVEHVHLHNVTDIDHQGLGDGFLSVPKAVRALKEIEYDGGVVLEIQKDLKFQDALVESKKILDILWDKW